MSQKALLVPSLLAGLTMFFGIAAVAGELAKEGTYSGTYAAFGTFKPATPEGKDRVLLVWDENGLQVTNGMFDHTTWHCWGTGDFTKGVGNDQGYCVATDPAGDQIFQSVVSEKRPLDQKSFGVSVATTGGTGRYAGISGEEHDVCHSGEFKAATEGTYVQYCNIQGNYKLP
jgi:hypothetical protein